MYDSCYQDEEYEFESSRRAPECRMEKSRELSGREKQQHRARYRTHVPPKLRVTTGAQCRRNKRYTK